MFKRTTFTAITPLPRNVRRETAVGYLHNYDEMLRLNPSVIGRRPIPPPPDAAPEVAGRAWYGVRRRQDGPQAEGEVQYTCGFSNLLNGVQTYSRDPLGADIREKWTVGGFLPGEPPRPIEPGIGAPPTGLYLREDVDMWCSTATAPIIEQTLRRSHATLIRRLSRGAQAPTTPPAGVPLAGANSAFTNPRQPPSAPYPARPAAAAPAPAAPPPPAGEIIRRFPSPRPQPPSAPQPANLAAAAAAGDIIRRFPSPASGIDSMAVRNVSACRGPPTVSSAANVSRPASIAQSDYVPNPPPTSRSGAVRPNGRTRSLEKNAMAPATLRPGHAQNRLPASWPHDVRPNIRHLSLEKKANTPLTLRPGLSPNPSQASWPDDVRPSSRHLSLEKKANAPSALRPGVAPPGYRFEPVDGGCAGGVPRPRSAATSARSTPSVPFAPSARPASPISPPSPPPPTASAVDAAVGPFSSVTGAVVSLYSAGSIYSPDELDVPDQASKGWEAATRYAAAGQNGYPTPPPSASRDPPQRTPSPQHVAWLARPAPSGGANGNTTLYPQPLRVWRPSSDVSTAPSSRGSTHESDCSGSVGGRSRASSATTADMPPDHPDYPSLNPYKDELWEDVLVCSSDEDEGGVEDKTEDVIRLWREEAKPSKGVEARSRKAALTRAPTRAPARPLPGQENEIVDEEETGATRASAEPPVMNATLTGAFGDDWSLF